MDTKFRPGEAHPNFRHGLSGPLGSPGYKAWAAMKQRCHNPKSRSYPRYGGRGIRVCEAWRDNFEAFWAEMGPTYQPGLTIDRWPNNEGDYEPGNCRWATPKEQQANRRCSIHIETPWGRLTLVDTATKVGILHPALWQRYKKGLRGADLLAPPNSAKQTKLRS